MPKKKNNQLKTDLRVRSLKLHRLEFARNETSEKELQLRFALGAIQLAPDRLGVEFDMISEEKSALTFLVSYRIEVERLGLKDGEVTPIDWWRGVAARMVPLIIYPYMRETITSLASKSGLPSTILPILNVGGMFQPEEIEIGGLDESEDEQ